MQDSEVFDFKRSKALYELTKKWNERILYGRTSRLLSWLPWRKGINILLYKGRNSTHDFLVLKRLNRHIGWFDILIWIWIRGKNIKLFHFQFQKVNEQSLKLLHSNVQSIESGISIGETSLTFFKKIPGLFVFLFFLLLSLDTHTCEEAKSFVGITLY